jgi:outer membrane immunogenic protein
MKVRVAAFGALVATGSALLGGSASADGYSRPLGYAPEPFVSWTGFYIGAHAGGAWSDVDWANVSLTGERVTNDDSGFIGGGQIGYNKQFGSVVVGVEGTVSWASLDNSFRSVVNPDVTYSTNIHTIVTATGRLGYAGDKWLVYGKAGWAGAQVDVSGRDVALPDSFSIDDWRNGWTVGTGIDYKLTRNISLGVEYSYIDLGSQNFASVTRQFGFPLTIRDHDTQIQSVTARLNFQFNRDEYQPLK